METRILRTDFWEDDKIVSLNIDTKLLYLCLLTNPKIGQLRIYRLTDRQMSFMSGFSVEQLKKCKSDLESEQLAYFYQDYVCMTGRAYVESTYGGEKNAVAKQKAINEVGQHVLSYFNTILDTLSIPYQYSIDTAINLNHKSKSKDDNVVEIKTETFHGIEYQQKSDVWELLDNGDVRFKKE